MMDNKIPSQDFWGSQAPSSIIPSPPTYIGFRSAFAPVYENGHRPTFGMQHYSQSGHKCALIEALENLSPKQDAGNYRELKKLVETVSPLTLGKFLVSASAMGVVRDVRLIAPVAVGNDMFKELNIAFVAASRNCHEDVMQVLLENGADLHYDNDSALRKAVMQGHVESVDFLLQRDADVHIDNDSLCFLCCKGDYVDVLELLVKYDIDLIKNYQEAFDICSKYQRSKCLDFLVRFSAKNISNNPTSLERIATLEDLIDNHDGGCNTDSYSCHDSCHDSGEDDDPNANCNEDNQ